MANQEIFGDQIQNPLATGGEFSGSYGNIDTVGGGLVGLISNLIKFATVAAGIWAVINLIIAGFTYVVSGDDPKATAKAWQKITMSLIGLSIMAGAYAIIALVSYVLFGDIKVILDPQIYGPGAAGGQ